jgi:hypothetical protein
LNIEAANINDKPDIAFMGIVPIPFSISRPLAKLLLIFQRVPKMAGWLRLDLSSLR